jgi:hypothetical protein
LHGLEYAMEQWFPFSYMHGFIPLSWEQSFMLKFSFPFKKIYNFTCVKPETVEIQK